MSLETQIGTLGFPIAVTIYLLYERTKLLEKLDKITEAINNNTNIIAKLCEKIGIKNA